MQKVIDTCAKILARFEPENLRMGEHWHTPTREEFITLTKCVKQLAETLQRDAEEID